MNSLETTGHLKGSKARRILLWAIAIVGYYCWFQALYNNIHHGTIYPYVTPKDAVLFISYNFVAIAVIFVMNLLIVFKINRCKNMRVKVFLDVILSFVGLVIVNWAYLLIHGLFRPTHIDWTGTVLNNIIILLMAEAVYYFQSYKESQKIAEEAGRKIIQYKYDALKAQINPHFLFNSLSLLSSLVSIEPKKAKKFIIELANMYRYIMAHEGSELTTVDNEMEFLQSYLQVLEMRYNNKFKVVFYGEAPGGACIVPYTMQLLIENVTKHNVISSKSPMEVTVTFSHDQITICNPVLPRPTKNTSGIGLRYLKGLYASHGKEFRVINDGENFIATIPYINNYSFKTSDL
ncbi:MAG: histidine kinase [Bacteroides sp.]|nr:histidine kinase [Bacteroides sp.]